MEDKLSKYAPASPSSSPYRRPRSPMSTVSRDRELERIASKYAASSPVGPHTVFLSKKMKELTEASSRPASSPASSTRPAYERTKSYDRSSPAPSRDTETKLGSAALAPGAASPTDSFIDRMIMSAQQQDIGSPLDFGLSRHSSIISLNKHHGKESPFHEYRSLPSSRLLETDAMKSYNLESKYPEGRKSPSREQARDKAGAMSLYESSPLHTYNQAQAALSARDRASSLHDLAVTSRGREQSREAAPGSARQRTRHSTLPHGVGAAEITHAKFDMDMKNILRELEDTGFFQQSRSVRSGYSAASSPAQFASMPLSLPLSPAKSHAPTTRPTSPYGHAPTRPTTAMSLATLGAEQPLIVLSKKDLDDFLRDTTAMRSEAQSRADQHNEALSSYSAAQSRCVTPAASLAPARDSWAKKKNLASQSEVDYKKLALVNDDLLKMWEESQAENTKLRLELSGVRSDLETARHQLEGAEKRVMKNNAVTDQEKREKKIVVKKLAEMEEELKLLALSENLTDQTLDQLKSDNCRLRDENTALLRVIAKMSKCFKLNAKVRRVVWLLSRHYGVRLPKTFYLARIDEDPLESVSESCGDTDWA